MYRFADVLFTLFLMPHATSAFPFLRCFGKINYVRTHIKQDYNHISALYKREKNNLKKWTWITYSSILYINVKTQKQAI